MTSSDRFESAYPPLARAVAGHGLAGRTMEMPARPLSDADFGGLLDAVREQRLTGLLWAAIESGALPVTVAQQGRAEWLHVGALAGVLTLERLLLETASALEDAGIAVRVLNGAVLAHVDYPDSDWRTFGDVDLMVRSDDHARAVELLEGLGHARSSSVPRPGRDRRYGKGARFLTADGLELRLHRTSSRGPLGVRLTLDDPWSCAESFRLAGHKLEAPAVEERFVHACCDATPGNAPPPLVLLRDVAQLALTGSLDGERVHRLAGRSGGGAVITRAVQVARRELAIDDVPALRSLPSRPQQARFGTRHSGRFDRMRHGLARAPRRSERS